MMVCKTHELNKLGYVVQSTWIDNQCLGIIPVSFERERTMIYLDKRSKRE